MKLDSIFKEHKLPHLLEYSPFDGVLSNQLQG